MKKIVLIVALCGLFTSCNSNAQETKEEPFEVQKTEAQWKAELTADQFYILRKEGTERPFSSPLNDIKEPGTFKCAGCNTPLFETAHKFDSGTGWPSFDRPIEGNVAYSTDRKLGYTRKEEHCATCGGHLGHVFNDGPKATTGKRHCINGDALVFVPQSN
ncbi:peptide-methionine (R)-S-oxide reductase MsrB [Dokdonia sp. Hel_I_53]|uniref:peptide-methionine (R)-S-oxide reductase MsrB n=1 Tax=Dokdonia sp. Hel_I_53 TaxID=1566287 RepID=UPI00119AB513|nr:peptide-methionine (R)-S-oxide reductase MsrB [Dokdonia sp. Hel_I_53]TVZ50884.1 peptide-methionine (R)-S-oxide reductase [Dokdonia sp. Hel_I_53]